MDYIPKKLTDKQAKRERKMSWILSSIFNAVILVMRISFIACASAKMSLYLDPIIGISCVLIIEQAFYTVIRKNFMEYYLRREPEMISPEVQYSPGIVGSIIEVMLSMEQIKY